MKNTFTFIFAIVLFVSFAQVVSAHAVVSPKEANVGSFTNFSLGVPSEKAVATIGVRVIIPAGLHYVTPFVKPGWKIDVKKEGDEVTEISWTGGMIPSEQKDQFMWSLQVPTTETTLAWKVYQTYADGSVVSWDVDPNAEATTATSTDISKVGPFSTTHIVNDLAVEKKETSGFTSANTALTLSLVAIVLSIIRMKRKSV